MENGTYTGLEIAIVGMSLKFPGANSPEEFWSNLAQGKEAIKFYTNEELEEMNYEDQIIQDPNFVKSAGGVIQDKEYFDAAFFGYTPEEAILMDPQTRIFHEQTWKALEDSGIDVSEFQGRIGLYAGSSSSFYWQAMTQMSGATSQSGKFAASQLNNKDFLTTRISHKLNLKGPSYPVFTACSTSLVAVHLAGRSLLLGECDVAIAGGITVDGEKNYGYHHQDGMIFSKDGHTRAFDKDSSGTISGNGAGVVVLKRLKEALKDGDPVYAVIKGSAINNDGSRKTAFSAPSIKGQSEVVRAALNFAKVEPSSIQMVECHGTGTTLGDPIEIEALHKAFSANAPDKCAIGSVKTNIGHLDAAAGVAGLIKAALCLKHKQIAPSLHFKEPNPKLNLDKTPFYVNTSLQELQLGDTPIRAGVSSFGIGGTNAHVVLEAAPESEITPSMRKSHLITLSAKSARSLEVMTENMWNFLKGENKISLADAAYTLHEGRATFPHKTVFQVPDDHEALAPINLENLQYKTLNNGKNNRQLVFLFPGGGAQYTNMARETYHAEKLFREWVDKGLQYLETTTGLDYKSYLFTAGDREKIDDTEIALPLLFLVEYALAQQLIAWGLKPSAMMGHSLGEYVAACIAGVMSFQDGLKLVLTRGKLMKEVKEGSMLSISASLEKVDALLIDGLSIAAINSPESCVVSGEIETIIAFHKKLDKAGIDAKRIHIAVASHSHMMEPILEPFSEVLHTIQFKAPSVPYISNVTGDWIAEEEVDHQYWVKHLRNTVLYAEGMKALTQSLEDPLFVEVGPGNILTNVTQRSYVGSEVKDAVNLLPHPTEKQADDWYLQGKLGELWLYGAKPNWKALYAGESRKKTTLPTYHFDQQRFWIDGSLGDFQGKPDNASKKDKVHEWFYWQNWKKSPRLPVAELEGNCLLIRNQGPLSETLTEVLEKVTKLYTVDLGDTFSNEASDHFIIEPVQSDFQKLFKTLHQRQMAPSQVIFTVASGEKETVASTLKKFFQLTYLLKAIQLEVDREIKLTVVTEGLHDVLGIERGHYGLGMLLGPLRVATQENPLIRCHNVDVTMDLNEISASTTKVLLNELRSDHNDFIAAYRYNSRWVPCYEVQSAPSTASRPTFRKEGTYLITGGLGRIGYTVLDYLSRTYSCNLVITGRTTLPVRSEWKALKSENISEGVYDKVQKLLRLEANGSQVSYEAIDMTDVDRFSSFTKEMISQYGAIDGVIHSAALTNIADFQTITELDDATMQKHFQAKIHGLLSLNQALEGLELDFCLLMSSVSSLLGGLGYCAYASANLFMDHFTRWKNKHSDQRWISACWDGWEYLEDKEKGVTYQDNFLRMNLNEGAAAIEHVLQQSDQGVVIHSLNDLEARINLWSGQKEEETESTTEEIRYARPNILTPYKAPATDSETALVEIYQQFFKYDQVGINDNFFDLGGNSLKGVSMINLIQKRFSRKIEIKQFFALPTIRELAAFLQKDDGLTESTYKAIEPAPKMTCYPASSAQERLYFIQQVAPDSTAYNIFQVISMQGELDINRIRTAFQQLVDRHEVLRTSFKLVEDELVQYVAEEVTFKVDVQKVKRDEIKEASQQFCRPFDLSEGPLLRVGVLQAEDSYALMVDVHHIVSDGVSQSILINDFQQLYKGAALPELKLQYKDYAHWQRKNEQTTQKQEAFWLDSFEDLPAPLELPTDAPRPHAQSYKGGYLNFTFDADQKEELEALAKEYQASNFTTFLALYYVFLGKLTGKDDITVGTPVAGRPHADLEEIMGMFVNTLPLRVQLSPNQSFGELLNATQQRVYECFENQEYQYENLIDQLGINRERNHNPLFDVMFSYQNFQRAQLEMDGLAFTGMHGSERSAKFDLTLTIDERDQQFGVDLEYATDLFTATTINRFANCFRKVVDQVLKNPSIRLSEIELISADEKEQVLENFNSTAAVLKGTHVVEVFREVVNRYPDHVALRNGVTSITYTDLDQQSDALASVLFSQYELQKGERVAILADRSIETVMAELAILKAGGVYMPIDNDFPNERIHQMLEVGEARLVLYANREHTDQDLPNAYEYINISEAGTNANTLTLADLELTKEDLAYIMFTSGSTGVPKCVGVPHRSILRLVFNQSQFTLDDQVHVLQTGAPSFDATTFEIWGPLLNGGKVTIVSKDTILDSATLGQAITEGRVNHMFMTTGLFNVHAKSSPEVFQGLKRVIVGGEEANAQYFNMVQAQNSKLELLNGYGPTENTTFSTYHIFNSDEDQTVPIGKPLSNSYCYIVDQSGNLQPIGVPGELLLGGDGVALGYLNDTELTREKFVENPFRSGEKVYRSGDLAKWRPDGSVEFLGRIDTQFKINGFRIELGEIIKPILDHNEVKDAVLIPKKIDGEKHIIGFYISETSVDLDLQDYLSQLLPAYMVPAHMIRINEIPLNINGKVDMKALPEPSFEQKSSYEAPVTETEYRLVLIWSEVLKREAASIGVRHDFFQIGGNSLRAAVMFNKIQKEFQVKIALSTILSNLEIKALARKVEAAEPMGFQSITAAPLAAVYPLSSAQKRLLLLSEIDKSSVAYNLPHALEINGDLDVYRLEYCFNELIRRHQILSTYFRWEDDQPVQEIVAGAILEIEHFSCSAEEQDSVVKAFIRPFDLSQELPIRVGLIRVEESHYILLLDMHHIVSDGVSQAILIQDFVSIFKGQQLEPLVLQYKDYAVWSQQEQQVRAQDKSLEFWKREFEEELTLLDLPYDFKRPAQNSYQGNTLAFNLSKKQSDELKALSQEQNGTLYMTMFTLFQVLLYKLSDQADITVGTPVAGRQHPDVDKMMGMFVNTLAIRTSLQRDMTFRELLVATREKTVTCFDHQALPFEELLEELQLQRSTNRNPLFDVMFALENFESASLDLPGLQLKSRSNGFQIAKFDLTFTVVDRPELSIQYEYATDLFTEATIRRFHHYFEVIVDAVLTNCDQSFAAIDLLSPEEKAKLLIDFNGTRTTDNSPAVRNQFEQRAAENPNQYAIRGEEQDFTYRELNEKANQLAHYLLKKSLVSRGTRVGVFTDHSAFGILAMLGIQKAGATFVCISHSQPQARVDQMIEDAEISVILTDRQQQAWRTDVSVLNWNDETWQTDLDAQSSLNPKVGVAAMDPAYVIYTSGTTGRPKGIEISHASLNDYTESVAEYFQITEKDQVIQQSSLTFDTAVEEIWPTLSQGATLIVLPRGGRDVEDMAARIEKYRATMLSTTPVVLGALSDFIPQLKSLRVVISGGDILRKDQIQRFHEFNLYNTYGPSESTVCITYYPIQGNEEVIPIGQPIRNRQVYIVNEDGNLCPSGVKGELLVGGKGLALGYLNQPKLTSEKFIDHPYEKGQKLYRTGDLASWDANGNIHFWGRKDAQVKVRGYRVELSEVETALLKHPEISAVVSHVVPDNHTHALVAYYQSSESLEGLASHMNELVPEYMIPSFFIHMDEFPLTTSGKINKRLLPDPKDLLSATYHAPANQTEKELVTIWAAVLKRKEETISVTRNFFELGGQSLKATIMINRIKSKFGKELPLKMVFSLPTIREMAFFLQSLIADETATTADLDNEEEFNF